MVQARRPGERRITVRELRGALQALQAWGRNPVARQVAHVGAPVAAAYGAQRYIDQAKRGVKRAATSNNRSMTKRRRTASSGRYTNARTNTTKSVKRYKRSPSKKKSLRSRVVALEKTKPKLATYDYRNLDGSYISGVENQVFYKTQQSVGYALLEVASDSIPFIDRGATPAIDDVDLTDQTIAHPMDFRDLYSKIEFKNNNELTAVLDVYSLVVKDSTSITPESAMTSQDATYGITDADTNLLIYPTDFPMFQEHFKIVKHAKVVLKCGDTFKMTWNLRRRLYDPKHVDSNPATYHKGDHIWFMRIVGHITHGITDLTKVGSGDPQVDYHILRKVKLKYTAETPFHKIETLNSLDTMTGGAEEAGPAADPSLVDN